MVAVHASSIFGTIELFVVFLTSNLEGSVATEFSDVGNTQRIMSFRGKPQDSGLAISNLAALLRGPVSRRSRRSPGDMMYMKQIIEPDGKTLLVDLPNKARRQASPTGSAVYGIRSVRQTGHSQASHRLGKFPDSFCRLPRDSGNICPRVKRGVFLENFHYIADENRCGRFIYNGCGGNANRFSTIWECTQLCSRDIPSSQRKIK